MKLIRTGFDGLDISYPVTISEDIAEKLERAQTVSRSDDAMTGQFLHDGLMMQVAPTGALGGYAYRCDTGAGGPFGENWFFKKPNAKGDHWGVRVSCRALPLALDGLTSVRARIEATLTKLGLDYVPGTESIGRVDVACDILAPGLAPDRAHFVAHARSRVQEISDTLVQVVGRSGRVESITIGKNPSGQVVLYDKRAEVIATGKSYWWPIWNTALAEQGLSPLDQTDRMACSIWRIELRSFKRHLKDRWNVTTWADLRERLPEILRKAVCDVRFTSPSSDKNRARWPDHPIWTLARDALSQDMTDLQSMADPVEIQELLKAERDEMLAKQISGCILSRAALNEVPEHRLGAYAMGCADQIMRDWQRTPEKTRSRLMQARVKYGKDVE